MPGHRPMAFSNRQPKCTRRVTAWLVRAVITRRRGAYLVLTATKKHKGEPALPVRWVPMAMHRKAVGIHGL